MVFHSDLGTNWKDIQIRKRTPRLVVKSILYDLEYWRKEPRDRVWRSGLLSTVTKALLSLFNAKQDHVMLNVGISSFL